MGDLCFGIVCALGGAAFTVVFVLAALYFDLMHSPLFDDHYLD